MLMMIVTVGNSQVPKFPSSQFNHVKRPTTVTPVLIQLITAKSLGVAHSKDDIDQQNNLEI